MKNCRLLSQTHVFVFTFSGNWQLMFFEHGGGVVTVKLQTIWKLIREKKTRNTIKSVYIIRGSLF